MHLAKLRLLAWSMVLLLAGCGANHNAIHHEFTIPANNTNSNSTNSVPGKAIFVDAKQRAILAIPYGGAIRVCAEQAPDVFSVLSASLAADLDAGIPEQKLKAAIKMASSESGATIRRSQTVNLLSLSMLNTCLRYASGAIREDELRLQAARDQRMLVSVLAIEQLTSLGDSQPVVILNTQSQASGSNPQLLSDAKQDRDQKQSAFDDKKKAAGDPFEAWIKDKTCNDVSSDDKGKCHALHEAQSALDKAEKYYQAMLTATQNAGAAYGNANGTVTLPAHSTTLSEASIREITQAVIKIAEAGMRLDPLEHCLANANNQTERNQCIAEHGKPEEEGTSTASLIKGNQVKITPAKLFIQFSAESIAQDVRTLNYTLKACLPNLSIYSPERMKTGTPKNTIVRYYFEEDKGAAEAISTSFTALTKQPAVKELYPGNGNVKPGLIELWIANDTLSLTLTNKCQ
ncbi:hypothetical protein [Leeia aquatica]|uniref:Lipoprotein n=1 Tax=Leeia aquatica TaxID=2725557 RepID=A0A847SAV0_9NEIS|nr:hypothetical protein [Leeia aquatica]NLR74459.1 hypothetical protein [Leeia aquatica]